jgi:predicted ATPase
VQDAAYGTLLRARRRQLHARVAATLEDRFPETVVARPQLIAHHCTEAGLIERAVGYWLKAGQQAVTRSEMTEAVAELRNGLHLLPALADTVSRQGLELDLLIALARAMMAIAGYAAPQVGETYARAHQLAKRLNQPHKQLVTVLYGQFLHHLMRGELKRARQHADEMFYLGDERNNLALTVMARRLGGITSFSLGDFVGARALFEQCLRDFDPRHRPFYTSLAIDDIHCSLLAYLSLTLPCLGRMNEAREKISEALQEARNLAHGYALAHTLVVACCVDSIMRQHHTLLQHAQEAESLSGRHGFSLFQAYAETLRGWALASCGLMEEGSLVLSQSIVATRATGTLLHLPHSLSLLADAYRQASKPRAGLERLAEAADIIEVTEDRWIEADLYRLRGELLRSVRDEGQAEASILKALSIAKQQSARFWELRASTSLACLWRDQGKRPEARDLLAPIYRWFTEGFDTPDLQEAKALLEELE